MFPHLSHRADVAGRSGPRSSRAPARGLVPGRTLVRKGPAEPDVRLLGFLTGCAKPAPQDVQGRDRRELPDALPIARQAKLDGMRDRPREGEADDNGADRPALLFGRAGDTGRREAHVGAENPPRTFSHGRRRLVRHDRPVRHAEHRPLDAGVVGHDGSPEPLARTRHADDPSRDEAACQ